MKGKVALLVGGAVGYVLGTRAGRQRYEQIKSQAQRVWDNPKVQQTKTQAQDYAKEKAPDLQHKVADAAAAAKEKVQGSGGAGDVRTSDPADPSSPSYETSVSSPTAG